MSVAPEDRKKLENYEFVFKKDADKTGYGEEPLVLRERPARSERIAHSKLESVTVQKASRFLVTCNTNKTPSAILSEFAGGSQPTREMAAELLKKLRLTLRNSLKNRNNYKPVNDPSLSVDDILSIDVFMGAVEVGKIENRLHFHLKVYVNYNGLSDGYFHVNIPKIANLMRRAFPSIKWGRAPYINVRCIKTAEYVDSYINKDENKEPDFF